MFMAACLEDKSKTMNKKLPLVTALLFIAPFLFSQTLVKDIFTGINGANPGIIAPLSNGFLMYANSTGTGKEPWFSDGTEKGTFLLKDIQPGAASSDFATFYVKVGNDIFFVAKHMGGFNMSLWKTDGTVNGTVQIKDLGTYNIVGSGGIIKAMPMAEFKGALYFSFDGGTGVELWKSDGTGSGTVQLKDINDNIGEGSNPTGYTVYNNNLYFFANNGINGNELWKTDGTANGTVMVKDLYQGAISSFGQGAPSLFVFKNKLYFGAQGGHDEGVELYVTDGTANGTVLFKDINTDVGGNSYPGFINASNDYFIFRATTTKEGAEAWVSDGTSAGTKLLTDISAGTASSYPGACMPLGNKIVFTTYTTTDGSELWITDGTSANTKLLKNINPGTSDGYFGSATKIGNMVYFLGTTINNGLEIWETDGTEAGTKLQLETNPGTTGSASNRMIELGGKLYFNATITKDSIGNELYVHKPTQSSGVNSPELNNIVLYPNPVHSGSNLTFLPVGNEVVQSAQIFNQQGQLVYETKEVNHSITIPSSLKSGMYMLHVVGESHRYTSKLSVVQ